MEGGLSNELFVVTNIHSQKSVLVRVHPSESDSIEVVNRDEETRILAWLSQEGDAPKLYGCFANGRIEEFLQDYAPLRHVDMPAHAKTIARYMAKLHRKSVPEGVLCADSDTIWTRVDKWLEFLSKMGNDEVAVSQKEFDHIKSEWQWLKQQLRSPLSSDDDDDSVVGFCAQVVFCHMDLQSLNILKKDNAFCIIDYEYAGMNPRAADIANTFCEYCTSKLILF
jgi:thiamine kinase-like enzyme